jgi:carbonic anhydrase
MHLVHRDKVTKKPAAVVGILFSLSEDPDYENYFLDQMEPDLFDPDEKHDLHVGQLHIATFLRQVDFREFFHYKGSFTTPPCTEGINWFVVKQP